MFLMDRSADKERYSNKFSKRTNIFKGEKNGKGTTVYQSSFWTDFIVQKKLSKIAE